jgi:hypothetical protein
MVVCLKYRCSMCGSSVTRKLCEDQPGVHVYVWACTECWKEFGEEWTEYHHAPSLSEPPSLPELTPFLCKSVGLDGEFAELRVDRRRAG